MEEFASCMLNRQSTPKTSNSNSNSHSYTKNSIPYPNSRIPSNTDNISSKTENNVDLSWLPNYNDDNFSNGHGKSYQNEQNDFDDSWLPSYNETKKKSSTSVPNLNKPNHSHKLEHGLDDSWLPSSPTVKNENKDSGQNYTKNNPKINSNRSSLVCSPIVKNENKKNEGININRKSGNHDYWEQAREATTSSDEIQHAKVLHNKKTDSSRSQGQVFPSILESSVETDSLGGVSTLLRRWKDVETKSFSRKERSSSSSNNNNNHSRRPSKYFDGSERCVSPWTTDESFIRLESHKSIPCRSLSCCIPSQGINEMKAFDVEKEKIRMGNIIKKLSKEEELAALQAAKSTSESFSKKHKCVLGKTHLIRGRQAYLDFLSLIEFEKRRELESLTHKRVVSKFPHRGRVQAMLRARLIRLGAEPKLETKSHKHSVSKTMKTIWDKFSMGVKHGATPSRKVDEDGEDTQSHASLECSVGCSAVEDMEMTVMMATSTITTTTATNNIELETTSTSCNQLTKEAKDHHQSIELSMNKFQDVDSSTHSIQSKEDAHSEIMVANILDYHEKPQFQSENLNPIGVGEKGYDDSIQLQSDTGLENCHNWISEYSQSHSEWDENEFYYNNDWISEIARPRSDWEYMRQKRYQEMLHRFCYNRDLQELLERRSVSFFLSSNQRNKLDQLLVSRAQGCSNKQEVLVRDSRKEKEDDESRSDRQGSEYIEFNDQTRCSSTPAQPRSWIHPNAIYDSYQTPSQSTISSSLWQNNPLQTSSIEMELIYDLKRYVEKLHHEIMEIRKSVTTVKIEQSFQKPTNMKHNCCVCDAMQADSFLYRCGHMCTCYDCGLELQFTSGKCPICEAPIVDVVRAYAYSE